MLTALPAPTTTNMPDDDEEHAEGDEQVLEERDGEGTRQRPVADPHEACNRDARDREFRQQAKLAGEALGR